MQQLQVMKKRKKLQLWVESSKEIYMISQSLSSEVEQDNKYMIIELLNSNEEYEMISFINDDKLLKNQKTSSLVTVNKFYLKIWLIKKEYLIEL